MAKCPKCGATCEYRAHMYDCPNCGLIHDRRIQQIIDQIREETKHLNTTS